MNNQRIVITVLGRVLTILIGAVPATFLCLMAFFAAVIGFLAFVTGEFSGLIFLVWGLAGLYGTLSLWAVALGFVRGWSVTGLLVGTLAILPFAGTYLSGDEWWRLSSNPDELMYIGPPLVALTWLSALAFQPVGNRMPRRPERIEG